ncbi:hypothetical protein [Streptomyces sp. adm13(2018)]|nr:hypothetical protein [Streptomyces sp. adm13(2018)]
MDENYQLARGEWIPEGRPMGAVIIIGLILLLVFMVFWGRRQKR